MSLSRLAAIVLACTCTWATAQNATQQPPPHPGPQQTSAQAGSAQHPNTPPGPPHHRPPKVAVEACAGKAAGAACSFNHDGENRSGSCGAPPANGTENHPLACRPQR